jgi:hypothetical protein
MGVERTMNFPGDVPTWAKVQELLKTAGEMPIIRMIDGLPAFPDEIPEEGWKELRVTLSGGMITIRKAAQQVKCVTWGTQDAALEKCWQALCEAWATAGNGQINES